MDYFIVSLGWFAVCVVTAWTAGSRGRSAFGWFVCSAITGIFAFFVLLSLPIIYKEDKLKYGDDIDIYVDKDYVEPILRSPIFNDLALMRSTDNYSVCGVCFNPIIKQNSDVRRCGICDASLSYRREMKLVDAEAFNNRYITELNAGKTNDKRIDLAKQQKIIIKEGFIYQESNNNGDAQNILGLIRFIEGLKSEKDNTMLSINRVQDEMRPRFSFPLEKYIDEIIPGFGTFLMNAITAIAVIVFMVNLGDLDLNVGTLLFLNIAAIVFALIRVFSKRSKKLMLEKMEIKHAVLIEIINLHEKMLTEKVTAIAVNLVKEMGVIELSKILIILKVEKYILYIKDILSSCEYLQAIELKESNDVLYRSLAQENGKNIITVYLDDDADLRDDGSSQMA